MSEGLNGPLPALKTRKAPPAKKCGQPEETQKTKETDYPLEPLERNTASGNSLGLQTYRTVT